MHFSDISKFLPFKLLTTYQQSYQPILFTYQHLFIGYEHPQGEYLEPCT